MNHLYLKIFEIFLTACFRPPSSKATVYRLPNKIYCLFIFFFPLLLLGQIRDPDAIVVSPTPNGDVEKLVFDEFIKKGNCVEVFNIQPVSYTHLTLPTTPYV